MTSFENIAPRESKRKTLRSVMANLFKFYFDFQSPVSRPLWILFEVAEIPCEKVPVALRKGENRSNEFAINVNRFGKIPAINDNGFKLAESVAIFHYLGRKGIIPERWYPKDLRARTRIDEYLEWNQFNLFPGAGMYFVLSVLEPMRTGEKPNMDQVEQQKRTLIRALNDLENLWLKDKKYLTGDEVTFADLMAICSLEQVVGLQIFQLDDQRHANIKNWMERVKAYFGPTYQKAHAYLYKFGEVLKQNKK